MREYNVQDIDTLEEVYLKMRSWSTTHPNLAIFYNSGKPMCPKCSSLELESINPVQTNTQQYKGWRCKNCGGLARGRRTISDKEFGKTQLVNAV
jgi:DNA-directed RNA polymerase subunit RPC12/RpoP